MVQGEEKQMNCFITFEGIDGSGKSTVSKKVYDKLKSKGYKVVLTYEPTDTFIGKCVQRFIEKKSNPFSTAFAFISDRIEHCKKIKKWLDEGKIVLCDRYSESTYAYQGAQMEDIVDKPIKWLKDLSDERIILPDITFLFLIDPKDALKRIEHRDELIPFEKVDFLKKVHKNYLKLSNGERFIKLDATKTIDDLEDICVKHILKP